MDPIKKDALSPNPAIAERAAQILRAEHALVRDAGFTDAQATLRLAARHNMSTREVAAAVRR